MENSQTDKNKFRILCVKNQTHFTFLIVSVFFILSLIGIVHHEMWRDELQAWLIARDSSSLSDLFKNLKDEGHPGLWHTCLYIITRFTDNPSAMQFFHLLLATLVIYIFVEYSPFSKLQKLLFTFGYFPFFEYNIISRNYNLGVLCIFLLCHFFITRYQSYLLIAIILSLMFNTNAYTMIIAMALAITLFFEYISSQTIKNYYFHNKRDIVFSLVILALGLILALSQLLRSPEAIVQGEVDNTPVLTQFDLLINNLRRLAGTISLISQSYIPIPQIFNYHFWNTNIFVNDLVGFKISFLFSIILLFFAICIFIQKPVVLFLYLTGTSGIFWFNNTKYWGSLRHHGNLFILFLACLWLCNYYNNSDWLPKRFKRFTEFFVKQKEKFLTSILLTHVLAGIFAFSMDFTHPFSASQDVAKFINHHQLNNTVIVGSRDHIVFPLTAFLDRKIYYPESDTFGSFMVWSKRREVNFQEILEKVNNLVTQTNNTILLILDSPFKTESPILQISQLQNFSGGIVHEEKYYLYLVQRK